MYFILLVLNFFSHYLLSMPTSYDYSERERTALCNLHYKSKEISFPFFKYKNVTILNIPFQATHTLLILIVCYALLTSPLNLELLSSHTLTMCRCQRASKHSLVEHLASGDQVLDKQREPENSILLRGIYCVGNLHKNN